MPGAMTSRSPDRVNEAGGTTDQPKGTSDRPRHQDVDIDRQNGTREAATSAGKSTITREGLKQRQSSRRDREWQALESAVDGEIKPRNRRSPRWLQNYDC